MDTSQVVTSLILPQGVEVLAASLGVLGACRRHRRVLAANHREAVEPLHRRIDDQVVYRAVAGRQLGQSQRVR